MASILQDAGNQAYVMAYNDLYFLTFLIAVAAAVALLLHIFRDWLVGRMAAPQPETET